MHEKIKDHLDGVSETYFEHMFYAFGYGTKMILGGLAAILHAIIPCIFQTTASNTIAELHVKLQDRLARAKVKRNAEKKSD